ncbi:MAG TPA: HAMP domain-containing sensor histidine kinase [Solirubrobacteraceae bacterium]|nr:HAMP domain-containing sensor histidine kinase [Solirubrobacteraceae bacterium]
MRRVYGVSALILAGSAAVAAVTIGGHGTLETVAVLAAIGIAAVAAAQAVVLARSHSRAGPLSRQFAFAAAIVIAPLLLALVVIGLLMFASSHDVELVALIVVFVGVIAVVAGQRLAAAIIHDVEAVRDGLTAVGRGERELRIATTGSDELRELADAANAMIEQLHAEEAARDQSDAARRGLVAAVSHDLRTPITSLRLLADAVGDDIVDEDTRRSYLDRMRTHIDALGALIDDLFELSRLEAGDIRWSLERVPLRELVGETVAAMRVQADLKGVAVHAEVPLELGPARANPEKLQRVLFNLIQNAIRHTPADGSVVVRAEPVADRIEIEVADTGDGIATPDRDQVFEAFYRGGADASRTSAGAGLGLAVSRAIVEAHGGTIWLPDSPAGTRVRFSLPAAT